MRALIAMAAGSLLLAGCETAFVGRAPGGRYLLVEVNGRAPPHVVDPSRDCPTTIADGHIELDPLARRFELLLEQRSPCMAGGGTTSVERGSYLRGGPGLSLETNDGRTIRASEDGDTVRVAYAGLQLRFRRAQPPAR